MPTSVHQVPNVIAVVYQWQQGRAHPQGTYRCLDGVKEVIKQLPVSNASAAVRRLLSRVQVLLSIEATVLVWSKINYPSYFITKSCLLLAQWT